MTYIKRHRTAGVSSRIRAFVDEELAAGARVMASRDIEDDRRVPNAELSRLRTIGTDLGATRRP